MANHVKPFFQSPAAAIPPLTQLREPLRKLIYSRFNRVLIDGTLVSITFWIAYLIRFDGRLPGDHQERLVFLLPGIALLYLFGNLLWRIYRQVWHFVGLRDSIKLAQSAACSAMVAFWVNILYSSAANLERVPLGVMVIHPFMVYSGWVGIRVIRRIVYFRSLHWQKIRKEIPGVRKCVLLVGAGQAGLNLVHHLRQSPSFQIVGFLDDNPQLKGRLIEGYPVLGSPHELAPIVDKYKVDEVTLSMPSAPRSVLRRIATECEKIGVRMTTVPSLSEILLGKLTINRLRPVRMEDLLGRRSVSYPGDDSQLVRTYRDRRILVTGAGGSIGSELVSQLRDFHPRQIVLLDKDENSLYEVGLEITAEFPKALQVVSDIRDGDHIRRIFQSLKPGVVFHAAAYKHVPLMEIHPAEAILNNVIGTRNVVDASVNCGVRTFVLISTDKAVNPSSIMGASKRVAEMIVQDRARRKGPTRFCCVRFGNVLGSRASVVPIFQEQIRGGRALTVTHPEVRRYFMTIPEAVQLVIQAGSLGDRGEIFVLDMGDPIKISDLAANLIRLSGLIPGKDVQIQFTGLRPGEKLNEELLTKSENSIRNTRYRKIFVAKAVLPHDGQTLDQAIDDLQRRARALDGVSIRRILESLHIGYHSGAVAAEQENEKAGTTVA